MSRLRKTTVSSAYRTGGRGVGGGGVAEEDRVISDGYGVLGYMNAGVGVYFISAKLLNGVVGGDILHQLYTGMPLCRS